MSTPISISISILIPIQIPIPIPIKHCPLVVLCFSLSRLLAVVSSLSLFMDGYAIFAFTIQIQSSFRLNV